MQAQLVSPALEVFDQIQYLISYSNPTWIQLKRELIKTNKKINTQMNKKCTTHCVQMKDSIVSTKVKENRLKLECV